MPRRSHPNKGQKLKGFRSGTEKLFYDALMKMRIPFEYEKEYTLTGPSIHKNAKVRILKGQGANQVKMTVDFVFTLAGVTYLCDTKGTEETVEPLSKLKYNLLKHKLIAEGQGDTTEIRFIYHRQVLALSKLSLAPNEFWKFFLKIKQI